MKQLTNSLLKLISRGALSVAVLAICAVAMPATAHGATLLDRVNEALTAAGLPVNAQTQQSFAACVVSGHYKTFDQLVNGMKWHKDHGRLTANCVPAKMWTFSGVVTEVNPKKIEVSGQDKHKMLVTKKFTITPKTKVSHAVLLFDITAQQRTDIGDVLQRGSSVKVWYNHKNEAVIIQNLAPSHDASASYGPIDCPTCQGGVNHIDAPAAPTQNDCDWGD